MKINRLIRPLLIIAVSVLLGFLILTAAYAVPAGSLKSNAQASAGIFDVEKDAPVDKLSGRMQDNSTDALMLNTAAYSGEESLVEKAIKSYRYLVPGKNETDSFVGIFGTEPDEGVEKSSYERYWHGYAAVLRPLLALFDYGQIRVVNAVLQGALILGLIYLMLRRLPEAIVPFVLLLFLLAPTAIAKCLQYSSVYYVMLLSCALLLLNPAGVADGDRLMYLFLVSGVATAFLDLLTAPTLTLTVPLALLCLKDRGLTVKEGLRRQLHSVIAWFAGFAGMWAGKWLIVMVESRGEFLHALLDVIMFRSSATNGGNQPISRFGAVLYSVYELLSAPGAKLAVGLCLLLSLVLLLARKRRIFARDITALLYAFPVLICVAWIYLLSNHAVMHILFVYRTIAPTVFCLMCMIWGLAFPPKAQ